MERPRSGLAMLRELWCLRLTPETMAFSGCSITSGVGKGLVTDTGMKTRAFHQRARKNVVTPWCLVRYRTHRPVDQRRCRLDGRRMALFSCAQGGAGKTTCFASRTPPRTRRPCSRTSTS